MLWSYVPQAEWLVDTLRAVRGRLPLRRRHRRPEGRGGGGLPRRRGALRGARRPRARLGAGARRAHAHAQPRTSLYAPNVADTDRFATALEDGPTDPALAALPRPRIVFTGAVVATKLDLDLLERGRAGAAGLVDRAGRPGRRRRPAHRHLGAARGCRTCTCSGARPYAALPEVLRGADAALVPYAINDLTRSVFPMKVYEYLGRRAAGRDHPAARPRRQRRRDRRRRRPGHASRRSSARSPRTGPRRGGRARWRCAATPGTPASRRSAPIFRGLPLRDRINRVARRGWATRCASTRRCARFAAARERAVGGGRRGARRRRERRPVRGAAARGRLLGPARLARAGGRGVRRAARRARPPTAPGRRSAWRSPTPTARSRST